MPEGRHHWRELIPKVIGRGGVSRFLPGAAFSLLAELALDHSSVLREVKLNLRDCEGDFRGGNQGIAHGANLGGRE